MPCRDYEYEEWLGRAWTQLDNLRQRLALLCQAAEDQRLPLSAAVAEWWQQRKEGREPSVPVTQETLDHFAQLLCELCQMAEAKGLPLPPSVAGWWLEHKAKDEATRRTTGET